MGKSAINIDVYDSENEDVYAGLTEDETIAAMQAVDSLKFDLMLKSTSSKPKSNFSIDIKSIFRSKDKRNQTRHSPFDPNNSIALIKTDNMNQNYNALIINESNLGFKVLAKNGVSGSEIKLALWNAESPEVDEFEVEIVWRKKIKIQDDQYCLYGLRRTQLDYKIR